MNAIKMCVNPLFREKAIVAGPVRVQQWYRVEMTPQGKEKLVPDGNLRTSAEYKAYFL